MEFTARLKEYVDLLQRSVADALHISSELVGRSLLERRAPSAICLNANASVMTALANDYDYDTVFSRQVEAHGMRGGVFLAISTSGNSENVRLALRQAQALELHTIGLTGETGGKIAQLCDILLNAPSSSTLRIREMHLPVYHYICKRVEARLSS
jgi:D-sedoheptulose 7-phosphate isomerase